jgi:hypothetical protein
MTTAGRLPLRARAACPALRPSALPGVRVRRAQERRRYRTGQNGRDTDMTSTAPLLPASRQRQARPGEPIGPRPYIGFDELPLHCGQSRRARHPDGIGALKLPRFSGGVRRRRIGASGSPGAGTHGGQQRCEDDNAVHAGNSNEVHGACGACPARPSLRCLTEHWRRGNIIN